MVQSAMLHRQHRSLSVVMVLTLLLTLFAALMPQMNAANAAALGKVRVRIVHAVPDFGPVDVYINKTKRLSNVSFFTVSDYLTLDPGTTKVQVVPTGIKPSHTTSVVDTSFTFASGKDYSVVARGTASQNDSVGVGGTLVTDNNSLPSLGQARVRVAHFSPDAPAVDIYANGAKVVSGLEYRNVTGYLDVPAGTYEFGVAPAGGSVIYTTTATLAAGQVATAWANGLLGGSGAQAFTITPTIDQAASGTARVRVVHAVPDIAGSPVDVYLNSAKVATLDFFAATDYIDVFAGEYDLRLVFAGGNPATEAVIQSRYTLEAGKTYTSAARGTASTSDSANLGMTLVEDDLTLPSFGQARVRVAHFSPDAPAVDIYANGAKVVSGLEYRNVTGYLDVPAGTYEFGVAPAGGSVIYTTTATLAAGQVATAWANGLLGGSGARAFKVTPTIDAQASGNARLRAVHAVPDIAGSPVDVYLNGAKVVTFDFFDATDYLDVFAGEYDLRVVLAGGSPATEAVIQANITLAAGKTYSAIARGTAITSDSAALGAALVEDDLTLPSFGQARVRVAHFSPDAPAVDIYANGAKVVSGLEYRNVTGYLDVPAGTYEFGVAPAGGSVIYTTTATLAAGQVATAWANGLLGGSGAQAFKVTPTIDAQSTGAARVRVLNASPDAPNVDVFIGQQKVLSNVAFGQLSSYLTVNAGSNRVQIRAAGEETVVFETPITVGAGKDYTVAAIGLLEPQGTAAAASAFTVTVFEDINTSAPNAQAKLRVIHLSPNAPAIDVRAGTAVLFDDLTYPNASVSYQSVPAGTIAAQVTTADGQQTLLSTQLTLTPGSVSTVFALGLAGDGVPENQRLRALVATDAASALRIFVPIASR